jgi:DNA-binding beta-propeller fold protein YncE
MTVNRKLSIVAAVTAGLAMPANAAELKKIAEIPVPGEPMAWFDISYVDQQTQRYYLSDRSNKAVDVFDAKTNQFIGRVAVFVGETMTNGKADNPISGPNGVVVVGNEVWAGDGDSTVKVIDLKAMKIVDTFSTGGKKRADNVKYDPTDKIVIIINGDDEPPFMTMVSAKPGHKILGKLSFPDATDGLEHPMYNPVDGLVYQSIPELRHDDKKGGVAVIDPRTARLLRTFEVDNCKQAGIALGPHDNVVLGCNTHGDNQIIVVMNWKTGKVVANVPDIGGADQVNYNKKNNQYYIAARAMKGGPVLGVIDATTNKLVQKIATTGGTPHSVASNEADGHVFLPVGSSDGGCSCVQVFAPAP